jgi:hypothetical protein
VREENYFSHKKSKKLCAIIASTPLVAEQKKHLIKAGLRAGSSLCAAPILGLPQFANEFGILICIKAVPIDT